MGPQDLGLAIYAKIVSDFGFVCSTEAVRISECPLREVPLYMIHFNELRLASQNLALAV